MKLADIPLSHVSLPELNAFGLSRGWSISRERDTYNVWTDGVQEYLVPSVIIDQEAYTEALQSLVLKVSKIDERGPDDIAIELISVGSDRVNLSLSSASDYPGTVKLRDGVSLVEGAYEFYRSAIESRMELPAGKRGPKGGAVHTFLDDLILGPSEPSSYSIWVFCRVIDFSSDLLVKGRVNDFSRAVTLKMYENLELVRSAVVEGIDLDEAADRLIQSGVRPSLCESLADIGGSAHFEQLNIKVGWSTLVQHDDLPDETIKFTSNYVPYLRELSKRMKKRLTVMNVKLYGKIERLNRREGQDRGRVTMRVDLPREYANLMASFTLHDPAYHTAVAAHDQGLLVQVTGELDRSKESGTVKVESFDILKGL